MSLDIRVLSTDQEILSAFPLMATLRTRIAKDTFVAEVRRQAREGYEVIAGLIDGQIVALAGVRPGHTLARGEHLFVDDLVTAESHRGSGYARALLGWIASRAEHDGVTRVYLDSRDTAQGFYAGVGFRFLTSVPCWIETSSLTGSQT